MLNAHFSLGKVRLFLGKSERLTCLILMSEASQIQLQTSNILNVPLQMYEKDFTFIVNNEKFNTSRIISDLLSPKISSIHQLDPTLSSFTITTNSKGDFSHILELATFSKREIAENEIGFFSEVIEQLGNEDIFIKKKSEENINITEENVISLLQRHLKCSIFYKKEIENEIDFISSHFFNICESKEEELENLGIDILEIIINNSNLVLKDEDQLIKLINKFYLNDWRFSKLFKFVFFSNVENSTIDEFLSIFDYNNLTAEIWRSISTRLRNTCKETNDEKNQTRYCCIKKEIGKNFQPKGDSIFDGIIKHLRDETNNNIEKKINITSSVLNSNHPPSNVVIYEDQSKIFLCDQSGPNPWICFEFKENKIIPTCYQIRSKSEGANGCHPKSWLIEGSNDSSNWEVLDSKENCSILNGSNIPHLFSINNKNSKEFRYIRMKLEGKAWCGNYHLELDSFELYGKPI